MSDSFFHLHRTKIFRSPKAIYEIQPFRYLVLFRGNQDYVISMRRLRIQLRDFIASLPGYRSTLVIEATRKIMRWLSLWIFLRFTIIPIL